MRRRWSTGDIPEKDDVDQEYAEPKALQDKWACDVELFRKLVFILGQKNWTNSKPSDAKDIWNDHFKDRDDACGAHRLNWTGTWPEYRAFFEASRDVLFETERNKNEFFAVHFLKDGETREREQVRNGTRNPPPSEKNKKDASEIVDGIRRMNEV